MSEALDRSVAELTTLVASLGAKGREQPRARPSGQGSAADKAELSEEEARFAAVLGGGPEACSVPPAAVPGRAVIAWCDPLYPPALRQLADPPLCLFVRADCAQDALARRLEALCGMSAVAVVGTRTPSPYGDEMAALLGRDLTRHGLLVVSGLALGIDASAQAAAVATAGAGRELSTVGVLGCGADLVYPRANRELFEEVLRGGLLVSEFAWGVPVRPWRFPARNRVMAALSRAVIVVEGAARSGARLTADYALDCGREVLAVPGEAGRRLAEAPHALIRQGASLCESAADVVGCLSAASPLDAAELRGDLDAAEVAETLERRFDDRRLTAVLAILERGAINADGVARASGLPVQEVAGLLMELELQGLADCTGGGRYRPRRR